MENRVNNVILSVRDVKKRFGLTRAVDGVSFDVAQNEIITIIGRSGAGKSTIMRCINRLVRIDSGEIVFDGGAITNKLGGRRLYEARRKIGFIFQHFNLVYRLTVIQNVLHGRLGHMSTPDCLLGRYSEEDKLKAYEILKSVGLEDQIYKRAGDLSGGQKQRVGIARALMQEPVLLMCDEPIASLDPITSRVIMDLIVTEARRRRIACIINLHQVDFALEYSTRIIGMRAGRVVFDDAPDELKPWIIDRIYDAEAREANEADKAEVMYAD
ncbi:MAG: phosphonate ABC transporter ATP-binding protein [Oscillospiraceae bacterium]|jgi:phosphonate transport system ATP-binding protein|nr:phosphonate ABC transporter ATP-binding protein [Oscillospiraceae bacterium]